MPGVLLVEAMGQTAAALLGEKYSDKLGMFVGLDAVKFKKSVVPGDVLDIYVKMLFVKHRMGKAEATIWVKEKTVAVATLKFVLADK
jgi:3-hydroxyacyl-[acyl-carrier-protein] dehydratase